MAGDSPCRRAALWLAWLRRCSPSLQGVLHQAAQHGKIHRLGDEIEGASLERGHRRIDVAMRGDHRHRGFRIAAGDELDQALARAVRQAHVGEAQVVAVVGQLLARRGQVGRGVDPQAHPSQGQDQQFADVAFVVDDQGGTGGSHAVQGRIGEDYTLAVARHGANRARTASHCAPCWQRSFVEAGGGHRRRDGGPGPTSGHRPGLRVRLGRAWRGVAGRGGAGRGAVRKGRRVRGGDTAHARLLDDRSCAWIG
jgi:hypothetical protein